MAAAAGGGEPLPGGKHTGDDDGRVWQMLLATSQASIYLKTRGFNVS